MSYISTIYFIVDTIVKKKLPAEILTVFIGRGFCFPIQLIFKLVLYTQMYMTSASANLVVLCASHSGLMLRRGGLVLVFLVHLLCFVLFLIFVTSELANFSYK